MLRTALFASLFFSSMFSLGQDPSKANPPKPDEPAYRSDPKFRKAIEASHGKNMPLDDYLSALRKANKIAGGQCIECLRELVKYDVKYGTPEVSLKDADQMLAVATTANDKFIAQNARGSSLLNSSDKPKPAVLEAALSSFNAALALAPHASGPRFQTGRVLALLGREDEARLAFTTFLADAKPDDRFRIRAEHFAADPHLASLRMAPPFTIHTANGETLSLDGLNGKVILMDFWATWCGPCRETLPDLKRIAAKYKDAPLVVISVSRDADDKAWKAFIEKEGMVWPQYRDSNDAVANAYGVNSIPRFFAIDTDGVLTEAKLGSGTNIDGMVNRLVSKAIKAQKNKPAVPGPQTVGQ